MSGMRWSEDELRAHQAKTGARISSSFGAGMNLSGARELKISTTSSLSTRTQDLQEHVHEIKAKKKREPSKALLRAKEVAESVRTAVVSGHYLPGESLELVFDGAKMLSINDLYKLTHYQRVDYRNAWHEAVKLAVMQILGAKAGQIASLKAMQRFRISAIRHSKTLCDTDALQGYFKYAIDGLRYANVIVDDKPKHFIDFTATQMCAPHMMGIRVEAVSEDAQGMCQSHANGLPAFTPYRATG